MFRDRRLRMGRVEQQRAGVQRHSTRQRLGGAARAAAIVPLFLCCVLATQLDAEEFDFGILGSRDTSLRGEKRLRLLGPFYESRIAQDGSTFRALRPFYSRRTDAATMASRSEFLWPLGVARERDNMRTVRFGTSIWMDFDTEKPESRYRFWILPVLFMGRDIHGEEYFGLFPLGGRVNEILMMDETAFFLFPLYSQNYRNGTMTRDFLWPFLSYMKGEDASRLTILPFYGRSVHKDRSMQEYVLWPLWTSYTYSRQSGEGFGFILFPLIGHLQEKGQESWLAFPPFLRWTRKQDGRSAYLPWPFIQGSTGSARKLYLWPLIGAKEEEGVRSRFFLWPIVTAWHRELPGQTVDRLVVMPVLQTETRREPCGPDGEEGAVLGRAVKVWPVLSSRCEGDKSVLRVPDLWPTMDVSAIENNYAPFWTLYSRKKIGSVEDIELLWGLYRCRSTETGDIASLFPLVSWERSRENCDRTEWSLLRGLIGYRRIGSSRRIRLLYLPFESKDSRTPDDAEDPVPAETSGGTEPLS